MADTRGAAHALARYAARPRLVALERESEGLIEPLPIAALRLPRDTVDDLRRLGFERIDQVGVPFDPAKHEAVSAVEVDDVAPGTVVHVVRPGYGEGSRQLRPASVVVSTGPQ